MAVVATLKVQERTSGRKSDVRGLRLSGFVPGVIYGGDKQNPQNCSVDVRHLNKEIEKPGFFNHLFEIELGKDAFRALVRDVQFHPVTDVPIHVDFMRVTKDARVTVSVPVRFINDDKAPGIKRGGILNIVTHDLEISTLAESIPEHITVDLTGVEIGGNVHLDKIDLPKGVQPLHPERDQTLCTLVAPSGVSEDEDAEETEAESSDG